MNTPNPRQIANRLNRLRANIAANQMAVAVPPVKAGFWAKFMFYARGGYDTPDGPVLPTKAAQTTNINSATVSAPYTMADMPIKPAGLAMSPKSVASFLLMPQIGQSFKSLSFAWVMLIQIIAGILVSNRLLPSDHPAATYRGAQQTRMRDLFTIARQNFHFNLKDSPRAVVWVSLVAFIFVVGGLLTTAAAKLFFSTAHAQTVPASPTSGVMTSSQFTGDVASKLIDSFFGFGAYANGGVPAINTLISTFNYMILIFGGIILIMTVISVVAETARTGVPFGKNFNPVWAPIRLIIAIAFMVPLANGLSSGQNILLNLVKWSSDYAANKVWKEFSKTVYSGENSISGVLRDTSDEDSIVYGSFMRQSMLAYNNLLFCKNTATATVDGDCDANSTASHTVGNSQNVSTQAGELYLQPKLYVMPPIGEDYKTITDTGAQSSSFRARTVRLVNPATHTKGGAIDAQSLADGAKLAGYIEVHAYDVATYGALYPPSMQMHPTTTIIPALSSINVSSTDPVPNALQANYNAYMEQERALNSQQLGKRLAQLAIRNVIPELNEENDDAELNSIAYSFADISNAFEAKRDLDVKNALTKFKTDTNNQVQAGQKLDKELNAYGWVGAPNFIGELGQLNADFQDAIRAVPRPVVTSKDVTGSLASYIKPWAKEIDGTVPLLQKLGPDWWDKDLASASTNQTFTNSGKTQDKLHLILASAVFDVTNANCDYGTLSGCEMHDNPLVHMASVGKFLTQAMVDAFFKPSLDKAGLSDQKAAAAATEMRENTKLECQNAIQKPVYCKGIYDDLDDFKNRQAGAQAAGMSLVPFGIPFLTFGFMLGFFLPLLPMFRYLLGFLGWLLLLFEAVLAIPLLGIGHLKTDGEGLMGPMNQGGYLMILGLLIKPVLMVLGLISGLIIFNGIIQVTAYTLYPLIFKEQNITFFALDMLLFASFITVLGNSAFKTIDIIPNSVISWIGGRMDTKTDDAAGVQSQALGTVQSLGQSVSFTQGRAPDGNGGGGNGNLTNQGSSNAGPAPASGGNLLGTTGGTNSSSHLQTTNGGGQASVPTVNKSTPSISAYNPGNLKPPTGQGRLAGGINGSGGSGGNG